MGKGTIYYEMNKQAQSDENIDFSKISSDTNGKGVYKLSSSINYKYPILYYRGAVTNNNVIFANFCWKIVRTTETGGIKLIYNGVPTNDTCNNTGADSQIGASAFNENYNDNAYVGYMYGNVDATTYEETHKNTNDSTIKKYIDNWYKNNMTSYTSKLEDTIWCNDRSIDFTFETSKGYGKNASAYMARYRLYINKKPNLRCLQDNDEFTVSTKNGNGALTYPIGLITLDEMAYAGGLVTNKANTTFYLYTGNSFWTSSPDYFGDYYGTYQSYEFYLASSGIIGASSYDYSNYFGIRPCISLKPETIISNGSGELNSPYIIK